MAHIDLIARVYAYGDLKEAIEDEFKRSSCYVAPRIRRTRPQARARGERERTEPPLDTANVPSHYYLPCIELRLGDIPRTHHGITFGANPDSDVVLPNCAGLSYNHFTLTFDKANRLIVKDWNSSVGTEVTYDDQGYGVRSRFQWIVGGHDVPERMRNIIITLPSEPPIKLKIIVAQHNIQSPEYVDKVDRFCQGSATAQDLFAGLDIPKRQDTRRPTGAHTPGTGDIHLTKVLGQGSFAVVTHYWNVSTGEEHAQKEPSRKAIREGRVSVEAWENEKHIMGLISHHSIVRLLGSDFTGLPRLYLEYVPGGSLADQQDISTAECMLILRQCLSALNYIHNKEIVHRDIKAENILVQYRTWAYIEVKLADFGLSKDDDNLSTICGNLRNLAPEVYHNQYQIQAKIEGRKSYDSAVDIWSLGTVVYGLRCSFPSWKAKYEFRGRRWAEKILDRFREDYQQRPNDLKYFLLGAMVVIRPDQRWSTEACLRAAEQLPLPAQSRQETPTPTSPAGRGERRAIRDQGEQSTIVPDTIRQPISSRVASDSMAARRFIGSGAPSMQASRKRPTTVSTSSSSPRRQSKRRGGRLSRGSHTHHSGQKRRDSDAQARTRYSTNRPLPSQDGSEVYYSRTARSQPGDDNLAQDYLGNEELVSAALLQQLRQDRGTNLKAGIEASQTGLSSNCKQIRQTSQKDPLDDSYFSEWEGLYTRPFTRSEVLESVQWPLLSHITADRGPSRSFQEADVDPTTQLQIWDPIVNNNYGLKAGRSTQENIEFGVGRVSSHGNTSSASSMLTRQKRPEMSSFSTKQSKRRDGPERRLPSSNTCSRQSPKAPSYLQSDVREGIQRPRLGLEPTGAQATIGRTKGPTDMRMTSIAVNPPDEKSYKGITGLPSVELLETWLRREDSGVTINLTKIRQMLSISRDTGRRWLQTRNALCHVEARATYVQLDTALEFLEEFAPSETLVPRLLREVNV